MGAEALSTRRWGNAMVSPHVFSQLGLGALLWLVVLVHLTRPKRPVTAPATPTEEPKPLTPTQPRAQEPKPFEGLTQKPQCALCEVVSL